MSNIVKNQELADSGISIADSEELARPGSKSAAQTPAPPKERIKGSKENPEGTAATRSKAGDIEISEANEQALKDKIAEFIKDHPQRKVPSLGTLKKVFRRGAGAFSTSFRPTISGGQPNSRNAWAMARVNKFLKMAGGGEVKESYRKADGDLLEERFEDCGTGAGGFKPGNTCAGGVGENNDQENQNYPSFDSFSKTKSGFSVPSKIVKESFRDDLGEVDISSAWKQVIEKRPQPVKVPRGYLESTLQFRKTSPSQVEKSNPDQFGLAEFIRSEANPNYVGIRLIDGWHRAQKAYDGNKDFYAYPVESKRSSIKNAYDFAKKNNSFHPKTK